jgi:hypothetical protein
MTKIWNSFSTVDYSYDRAGQVLREGNAIAGSNGQTAGSAPVRKDLIYTRFPSGEVSSLTYPSGFTVQRAYTARGQLENVIWNGEERKGDDQELWAQPEPYREIRL